MARSSKAQNPIGIYVKDGVLRLGFVILYLICIYWSTEAVLKYRISANSFRGNYSFLNLALCTVTYDLYFINLNSCRGNYSREETIQGRKLFAEIRYAFFDILFAHQILLIV